MPSTFSIFFSFSAFEESTVKKYMGIFFLIWETIRGWDHLPIVMIRPLELFQISEVIIPLSMFENMPEAKVSKIAWKIDLVVSN